MAESNRLSGIVQQSYVKSAEGSVITARDELEELQYLDIFPIEIWTIVLNKVNDNECLEELCNSFSFFRKILNKKRVEFLAPKVLQLLNSTKYLDICNTGYQKPFTSNLRKVCKSWCSGVDSVWEKLSMFSLNIISNKTERAESFQIYTVSSYQFGGSEADEKCTDFIPHFDSTHSLTNRNPFLGRAVEICISRDTPPSLPLLRKYGEHIWHAILLLDYNHQSEMNENLCQVLQHMPNIRQLEIGINVGTPMHLDSCNISPMPQLPYLQALKAERACPIVRQILRRNPLISYLEVGREEEVAAIESLLPVLNLRHLRLDLARANLVSPLVMDINTPILSALTVHWSNWVDYVNIRILENFFNFINTTWGELDSLTQVNLELPRSQFEYWQEKILKEGSNFRLQLKHVKKMVLLMENPCPVDFLLPMKHTLESLRIKETCNLRCSLWMENSFTVERSFEQGMQSQHIQFLGWKNQLLESNIWLEFPNLKELVLESHIGCSRLVSNPRGDGRVAAGQIIRYSREDWLREKF